MTANRAFLVNLLQQHGHRLIEAGNGREGLAAVQADPPDLVITDVIMPVMDGYEFVRQLRLDPAAGQVPVVFYTAQYGAREARALALSIGVAGVLTKPAVAATLLEIVGRVLSGATEPQPPADGAPPATAADHEHLRVLTANLADTAGDLRADNVRLRALINIGLDFASEWDLDRRLDDVCASVHDLFGATYVTLGLLDRRDLTVQRFSVCGTDQPSWLTIGNEVTGLLGTVVSGRCTLGGASGDGDPAHLRFPAGHPEVQAYLAVPITSSAHAYGWICLVGNEGQTFTEDDEELVLALAGQVGRIRQLEDEILERRQAEAALRHERDRAQRYLDTAEVILLALDTEGRVTLLNRKGCDVLGWSDAEILGRDWTETCIPETTREAFREDFRRLVRGDLPVHENAVRTKAGASRLVEWHNTVLQDEQGRACGTFSSGTDVTDRRVLEEQYQQAQKMDAIGRLAGGVAHDFNNLLTVILVYSELLLEDLEADSPNRAYAVEIQRAGTSAAALTRQLLAFSRKEIVAPALLDLNVVVGEMQSMLGRLIREDVEVALALQPGVGPVVADRGQLEQIVVNLAVNARDAMPAGGTLTIATTEVELGESYASTHFAVPPGPYVALTVSDTGGGMTPAVQARLFEPFFTTKEPGKGTGLGLATVHGIVTQCRGSVTVSTTPEHGTSFTVYFPRARPGIMATGTPRPAASPRSGSETVLVVEDADGIRELTRALLQRQGYTVLVASNGTEAMAMLDAHASIDLLLTDIVMPGTSGPELGRQLTARRPALKVLYMSGYTEDTIVQHDVLTQSIAFLHKPFTAEELGRKVSEVLDRPMPCLSA